MLVSTPLFSPPVHFPPPSTSKDAPGMEVPGTRLLRKINEYHENKHTASFEKKSSYSSLLETLFKPEGPYTQAKPVFTINDYAMMI